MPDLESHFKHVVRAAVRGTLIPFFGAGASLCGRPDGKRWQPGCEHMPSGAELSMHLAEEHDYPDDAHDSWNLQRVSQYVAVAVDELTLYEDLRDVFAKDYQPTPVHRFFGGLPKLLQEKGCPNPYQLILTTNYDDLMERAYRAAEQSFDIVSYIADSSESDEIGKFVHQRWEPTDSDTSETVVIERPIEKPNEYLKLSLKERPIILKLHGAVDRSTDEGDSYVITEDHYIEYLTRTDISRLLPVTLVNNLRDGRFLFLGYGLADWNLRAILNRVWANRKLSCQSWAVQRQPNAIDKLFWDDRGVDIFDVDLAEYIAGLAERFDEIEPK